MKKIILLITLIFILPTYAHLIDVDVFYSYNIDGSIIVNNNKNELLYTLLIKDFTRNYHYKVSVAQNLNTSFISIYNFEAYDNNHYLYNSNDYKSIINSELQAKKYIIKNNIENNFRNCKQGSYPGTLYCTK